MTNPSSSQAEVNNEACRKAVYALKVMLDLKKTRFKNRYARKYLVIPWGVSGAEKSNFKIKST
jgi:hypothetical protein